MSDDYLWDGSGEPDPEVQELEQLLSPLRHDAPLALPAQRTSRRSMYMAVAVAAVLVIAVGSLLLRPKQDQSFAKIVVPNLPAHVGVCVSEVKVDSSWGIQHIEGSPSCGNSTLGAKIARLPVGECFETDEKSRGTLTVAKLGVVNVAGNTKVCLKGADKVHRLRLARGTIHAKIDAPPRLFFVETKSATAVDLGCEYTLNVDEHGAGKLHVTLGYVLFERDGRESMVPAGNIAETHPVHGPGTPYPDTAPPELRKALRDYDFAGRTGKAFDAVVKHAHDGESIILWHLLARANKSQRARLLEKLTPVQKLPAGVARADILSGDKRALDAYRKVLEPLW